MDRHPRRRGPPLPPAHLGFPNTVRKDGARDRPLVSESLGGAIYAVPLDADDPKVAAIFWADGITVRGQVRYVAANALTEVVRCPRLDRS